jgi:hypothetical protein
MKMKKIVPDRSEQQYIVLVDGVIFELQGILGLCPFHIKGLVH